MLVSLAGVLRLLCRLPKGAGTAQQSCRCVPAVLLAVVPAVLGLQAPGRGKLLLLARLPAA